MAAYIPYFIFDGQSGLIVREGINANFAQLFNSQPVMLDNQNASLSIAFPTNTFIATISVVNISGFPLLAIGTTPGGDDILEMTSINQFTQIQYQTYNAGSVMLYFTWFNANFGNIRVDQIINYF